MSSFKYFLINNEDITGEGWLPTNDIPTVKSALATAGENSGSMIQPTMEKIPTTEQHPTYHR